MPLNWDDRFVYRLGVEFEPVENVWLRAGYSYGESPIPADTLTPLNAAISEHTLTAGFGFPMGRWKIDVGYQYELPNKERVGKSGLRAGEYSDSSTEVEAHWLGISTTFEF